MLDFYGKYAANKIYSQNGEEGIIEECLKRLKLNTGKAVEFGGHNGKYLSNTALLADKGWHVHFIEADFNLYQQSVKNWEGKNNVKHTCSMVGPKNVDAFVKSDTDIVSIDVDGLDHAIFKTMAAKPKIVIIEIDSSIPPDKEEFNREGGSGYLPMAKLAIEKGYFVLCHTGNMVLVANEYRKLFPEIKGDGIGNSDVYFRKYWLKS